MKWKAEINKLREGNLLIVRKLMTFQKLLKRKYFLLLKREKNPGGYRESRNQYIIACPFKYSKNS